MSQKAGIPASLSSAGTRNKFGWIYRISNIDEMLEKGWEYGTASLENNKYTYQEFIAYLETYSRQSQHKGPFVIQISHDEDDIQVISCWHETPLTEEDIRALNDRRQQLLERENVAQQELIRSYLKLVELRGEEWVEDEIKRQRGGMNKSSE